MCISFVLVFVVFPRYLHKFRTEEYLVRIDLPLFYNVVENKGKLILNEIFPLVQKHDI